MKTSAQGKWLARAAALVAERCPRLARACYWAGTAAVAIEELGHRESYDLDFHTRRALQDTRPLLAEIERGFPGAFEVLQPPDELGSGFSGLLALPEGKPVPIQVLSNYEDVPEADLTPSASARGWSRVTVARYLADKIQCVVERTEARDLLDIAAVLAARGDLVSRARRVVADQDASLLTERLLGWTDASLRDDLAAYAGLDPGQAIRTRDQLLGWLREEAGA